MHNHSSVIEEVNEDLDAKSISKMSIEQEPLLDHFETSDIPNIEPKIMNTVTINKLNLDFNTHEHAHLDELEKKDIVELTYRSNYSLNNTNKKQSGNELYNSNNVSRPELIDTARLFSKPSSKVEQSKDRLSK